MNDNLKVVFDKNNQKEKNINYLESEKDKFVKNLNDFNIKYENLLTCNSGNHIVGYVRKGENYIYFGSKLSVEYPDLTFEIIKNLCVKFKTKKKTKTNTNTEVKSISLNKNNVTISVGGTTKVNYTINPSTATNKNVTWIVENNDIATVYKDGKIKGNKVGTTKVTVKTHNNKTATLTVNVISNTINPTGISLNVTNRTIYEGDSFSLISIITPDNATDKSVTWTSSK